MLTGVWQVLLSHIPHYTLLHFGDMGHKTRLMFPGLYLACEGGEDDDDDDDDEEEDLLFPGDKTVKKKRKSWIEAARIEQLYDLALWPALRATTCRVHDTTAWPPSYATELFRLRKFTGYFNFSGRPLQPRWFDLFITELRRLIDEIPELAWAQDFFLYTEAYGTKGCNRYRAGNVEDEELARQDILFFLRTRIVDGKRMPCFGKWWVDKALEIHHPEKSVLLKTSGHASVMEWAAGISDIDADQLASTMGNGTAKFTRDLNVQLHDIAGFHLRLKTTASTSGAVSMQGYTTEKTALAMADGRRNNKRVEPGPLVFTTRYKDGFDFRTKYASPWALAVETCATSNRHANARIELRIPLSKLNSALPLPTARQATRSLALFDSSVMWSVVYALFFIDG